MTLLYFLMIFHIRLIDIAEENFSDECEKKYKPHEEEN